MLRGKWKTIILWRLRLGPTRPSKLLHDINNINEKMLLQHANELIADGFITRNTYGGYPLKVEYALTPLGLELIDALEVFQDIGRKIAVHTAPHSQQTKKAWVHH
ncbi:MAG: winged helix-turn-helix transcriptional regulator [Culicoidibacterales bacterium]